MINSNSFNIDFNRLAVYWFPTFLRKPRLIAFGWVLIYPLLLLYISVMKQRKQNLIKLNFNYQKFSLQKRLNDAFDVIERRIKIVRAVQYDGVFLYTEAEDDAFFNKTKWLHDSTNPIYLRTEAELYSEFDFLVEIPNTGINQIQMRAEIDFYKLPSKRYQIVIV